jgi:hypothetical protein
LIALTKIKEQKNVYKDLSSPTAGGPGGGVSAAPGMCLLLRKSAAPSKAIGSFALVWSLQAIRFCAWPAKAGTPAQARSEPTPVL